ncbi:MAG: glutamine-hydrolyzing GMP synthase [Elusimicrobia bacterium]|nr:glutamine-hydrolyzing GMP synthase [Elusimicrobiota bacterium]
MIVILDFGSQYTRLICKSVRRLGVAAEIYPYNAIAEQLPLSSAKGIILSGSPSSASGSASYKPDRKIFSAGVPVLGICYGMQIMAALLNGKVEKGEISEFGSAELKVLKRGRLFSGLPRRFGVWMSHYDRVVSLPSGFETLAETESVPIAAMGNSARRFYGVQFHPEVFHTRSGGKILGNFVFGICRAEKNWNLGRWAEEKINEIRRRVRGEKIIMALSGGVDSSVAAVLISRAAGKFFYPVFIDHGLTRRSDITKIREILIKKMGLNVRILRRRKVFLKALAGVRSPERKRKIIGRLFVRQFAAQAERIGGVRFLAQGTLYPDVIESASAGTSAHRIKTHHNVGGLPKNMKFELLEPVKFLFKDEVRKVGEILGIPKEIIGQHPFPGPGLAVRIIGAVTDRKINIVRTADEIIEDVLKRKGLYGKLWQAFAVLLPVKSVGVMGDARSYENAVVLRFVKSKDAMTADWAKIPYAAISEISTRIVNEVDGVNRVVYDITNKPPATIEWE